jgi:hypothetical protein
MNAEERKLTDGFYLPVSGIGSADVSSARLRERRRGDAGATKRNVSKEARESVIEMGTEGAGRLVRGEQGN